MHTERYKEEFDDIYKTITDYIKKGGVDSVTVEHDRSKGDISVVLRDMVLHIYINEQLAGYELYLRNNKGNRFLSDTDLYNLKHNEGLFLEMIREIRHVVNLFLGSKVRIAETPHRLLGIGSKKVTTLCIFESDNREKKIQLPCVNELSLLEFIEPFDLDKLLNKMKANVKLVMQTDDLPEFDLKEHNQLREWYEEHKDTVWKLIGSADASSLEEVILSFELYLLATNPLEDGDDKYADKNMPKLLSKLKHLDNVDLLSYALSCFTYDTNGKVKYELAKKYYKDCKDEYMQGVVVHLAGGALYDIDTIDDTISTILRYILQNYNEDAVDWMKFYIGNQMEEWCLSSEKKKASLKGILGYRD